MSRQQKKKARKADKKKQKQEEKAAVAEAKARAKRERQEAKLAKKTGMIDKITLGGVKSREGTRQISKAVFTTPKEEELIKELITDGVTVEIRQVPSDSVIYAKDVL